MNKEIGFDDSEFKQQKQIAEVTPNAISLLLIPIAKFLVGTAGAVILSRSYVRYYKSMSKFKR